MEPNLTDDRFQGMVKSAVAEVLEERPDLVLDAVRGALEDLALSHAIEEGRRTPLVERSEILKLLAD
jgi:hypothetical protein